MLAILKLIELFILIVWTAKNKLKQSQATKEGGKEKH